MVAQLQRLALLSVSLVLATAARAQDFPDTQIVLNRVLFAKEDQAAAQRAAERRRIAELDQRAQQQALLLQQQAASVERLGSELREIRDERQLIDLAGGFDAAVAAGRWPIARMALADTVTVDLDGRPETPAQAAAADSFIAGLPATVARGGILPRANQQVRIDGDRAVLTSDGFGWSRLTGRAGGRPAGQFEYGFTRTAQGWRIDSLTFRPAPLP